MPEETDETQLLQFAVNVLAEKVQHVLRGGSIGQGVWRSIDPEKYGHLVAVVRLPQGFVALNLKVSIDKEWTEHLGTEIA